MSDILIPRRQLFARTGCLVAAAGALPLLSGCDAINGAPAVRKILSMGEEMNRASQRALMDRDALAREFSRADLSPIFRSNGTKLPPGDDYAAHAANGFVDWRVQVTGLVARPLSLSLADVRAMPQRTQITRHDCVEGWSAIGQWTGPRLGRILAAAGVRDSARYIVFRCADRIGGDLYYESCDMVDALHPQTIMAWALNDAVLPIANGAPLRLRIERQLGYKHAKYVNAIEAVASLDAIGEGKGGYWEDRIDYEWYAGI
ncbi:MAG TPA: molybdopterin-binding protein [Sphingopyxis sp.]|uniref:molybdopterin-binding protein n=1 Tax=Sphingopyxis sp. TaxID=1908224 RepID=UPI002C31AD66|nr:molybdopterin-binding protein [Sphingopyxis sp.]HWW55944.1 molybdopterin-binding protein [Sphingopyxis sp.]